MTPSALLARLKSMNCRVIVGDSGRILLDSPRGAIGPELLALLRQHRLSLATLVLAEVESVTANSVGAKVEQRQTPTEELGLAAPEPVAIRAPVAPAGTQLFFADEFGRPCPRQESFMWCWEGGPQWYLTEQRRPSEAAEPLGYIA